MRIVLILLAGLMLVAWPGPVGLGAVGPAPPPKMIAFSFDDAPRGPGAFMTVEQRNLGLIAALKAAGVDQAAFFVNPGRITVGDGDERRLARYVAAGHVIANHTYLHPRLSSTPAAAYIDDIVRADAWLRGRPGFRPWFRFPALDEGVQDKAKRDAVRAALARLGLSDGYASVDGSDWYIDALTIAATRAGKPIDRTALRDLYVETMVQSADFSDALMHRTLGRRVPQMLLLHETDIAALFVRDLAAALRRDGWTIVTADAAFADRAYGERPDIPLSKGTLAEQLAAAHRIPGQRWYARNDRDVARALFTARVLHGAAAPAPSPASDAAALARAEGLPHIPVPLRGCWQAEGAADRLTVHYATITLSGAPARIAMADSVARIARTRIDGNFLTRAGRGRTTVARTLSLGPDTFGTPPGHLRLAGGGSGTRLFARCA